MGLPILSPPEVLFRDEWLAAVNKPPGMLVHRSQIDRHETHFAMQWVRDHLRQPVYLCHRLDKPTSGVLLFALNPEAARRMTLLFSSRQIEKRYLAVVRGYLDQGRIDYPLVEEPDALTDERADPDKPAQEAITDYRCLARAELPLPVGRYPTARYSLVEVFPRTGRGHQIRRHLKHIFHPIIGDTTHGDGRHNGLFREHLGCTRLLLAAVELGFVHPFTGASMRLHAAPGEAFQRINAALFSRGNSPCTGQTGGG